MFYTHRAPRFTTRMRVEFNTVSEVNSKTRASYIKKQIKTITHLYTADYPILKVTATLIGKFYLYKYIVIKTSLYIHVYSLVWFYGI